MMNKEELIKPGERLDDLQRNGLHIIQNPDTFCFGIDAVLLSHFAKVKLGERVLDMGCGNGIIPILLSGLTRGQHFTGLEIQKKIAEMAQRSVEYNELNNKVTIINGDIREATSIFGAASFDVITVNPPYMNENHGIENENTPKAIARHEIKCSLEDVISQASSLLPPAGRIYMVHRPFRLVEILTSMHQHRLEPKRMQLVYPFVEKEPNLVLIEGVRDGKSMIKVEKPLIVYEEPGKYTEKILRYYGF